MKGTIKKLIQDRGFGFIKSEDGQEVFFHSSGLKGPSFDSLKMGDAVEFELERSEKGPRAVGVRTAQ